MLSPSRSIFAITTCCHLALQAPPPLPCVPQRDLICWAVSRRFSVHKGAKLDRSLPPHCLPLLLLLRLCELLLPGEQGVVTHESVVAQRLSHDVARGVIRPKRRHDRPHAQLALGRIVLPRHRGLDRLLPCWRCCCWRCCCRRCCCRRLDHSSCGGSRCYCRGARLGCSGGDGGQHCLAAERWASPQSGLCGGGERGRGGSLGERGVGCLQVRRGREGSRLRQGGESGSMRLHRRRRKLC
mmetsp:Transcript_42081/g.85928  ORF Transcript_42081/g.85928 Transcript_42081/m.85928 type:complete len:240 (-) Transcript_42081:415-1134(-)